MLLNLSLYAPFDAESWQTPLLLGRCFVAALLLAVIASYLTNGEPEDPTDF